VEKVEQKTMKYCPQCQETKPEAEFYRDRTQDRLYTYCKDCSSARSRNYHIQNRTVIRERAKAYQNDQRLSQKLRLLGGRVCQECGEGHPACLAFHHRDPSTKKFNFNAPELVGRSHAEIAEELAKCDVLCENCHRKLHWRQHRGDAIDCDYQPELTITTEAELSYG